MQLRKHRAISQILRLIIILFLLAAIFIFYNPDEHRDEISDEYFISNCKMCCNLFSKFPKIDISRIQENIEDTKSLFFVASTAYYLVTDNDIISSLSENLSTYLTYLEFINVLERNLPKYNEIIEKSQILMQKNEITYNEAKDYFKKLGEYSGELLFSVLATNALVLDEFIEEIYHLAEDHGIKDKISDLFNYEELHDIKKIVHEAFSALNEATLSKIEIEEGIGELFSILLSDTMHITSKSQKILKPKIELMTSGLVSIAQEIKKNT